jgi:hypothetical protein
MWKTEYSDKNTEVQGKKEVRLRQGCHLQDLHGLDSDSGRSPRVLLALQTYLKNFRAYKDQIK